jgi:hypothetical protein
MVYNDATQKVHHGMARYLIREETPEGEPLDEYGPFEGLAVARALGQKKANANGTPVAVCNADTGEVVARFDPPPSNEPALARSVRRMRAANDRLKHVLSAPLPIARGSRK